MQVLAVFVTPQLSREFILAFIKCASHAASQHKYRNLISFIDKCEAKYTSMPRRSSLHSLSLPFRQKPERADETRTISAREMNCARGSRDQGDSWPWKDILPCSSTSTPGSCEQGTCYQGSLDLNRFNTQPFPGIRFRAQDPQLVVLVAGARAQCWDRV